MKTDWRNLVIAGLAGALLVSLWQHARWFLPIPPLDAVSAFRAPVMVEGVEYLEGGGTVFGPDLVRPPIEIRPRLGARLDRLPAEIGGGGARFVERGYQASLLGLRRTGKPERHQCRFRYFLHHWSCPCPSFFDLIAQVCCCECCSKESRGNLACFIEDHAKNKV